MRKDTVQNGRKCRHLYGMIRTWTVWFENTLVAVVFLIRNRNWFSIFNLHNGTSCALQESAVCGSLRRKFPEKLSRIVPVVHAVTGSKCYRIETIFLTVYCSTCIRLRTEIKTLLLALTGGCLDHFMRTFRLDCHTVGYDTVHSCMCLQTASISDCSDVTKKNTIHNLTSVKHQTRQRLD